MRCAALCVPTLCYFDWPTTLWPQVLEDGLLRFHSRPMHKMERMLHDFLPTNPCYTASCLNEDYIHRAKQLAAKSHRFGCLDMDSQVCSPRLRLGNRTSRDKWSCTRGISGAVLQNHNFLDAMQLRCEYKGLEFKTQILSCKP